MSSSPKQVFLDYINKLDMTMYSDSVRCAVELAKTIEESAFTDTPNWWPLPATKTQSNEAIARFIEKSATDRRDEDAEAISVTVNGEPGRNLDERASIKILRECLYNTIQAWKTDPLGKRPVVTTEQPPKAVISYPLSGSSGKKIADWIGLPPCYPLQAIPRWQRMRKSKCPELVVTITNAGHLTNAHMDNPCLPSDVYHIFGRKLWFIWDDCPLNTTAMMNHADDYDDIDLYWCYKNLIGLKLVFTRAGGAYFNPHIHLPPACWHAVISFSPSMAVSGYICDTGSYKRCMENMSVHGDYYQKTSNMAEELQRVLMYEISRAANSWKDYIDSEPDASGILVPDNFS